MKKLCFDAGHTKGDNQGNYKPYYEGTKMWDLHLMVKKYLEDNYKVEIITTRKSINVDYEVYKRGLMSACCDGFYSFHSNYDNNKNLERVVIIRGLGLTSLDNYSKNLGDTIKNVMGIDEKTQVWEREYKGGEYYGVLRGAKAVGVKNRFIIEHSWHSNPKMAKWLYDDNNLEKLAMAEGECIAKFHKLEKKVNSLPKMIKVIKEVNYRTKPIMNSEKYVKKVAKVGEVYTVVKRVKSDTKTDMFLLKDGCYITTSSKYVQKFK